MSFRLFGVNVQVQIWFWVVSAVLGWSGIEHTGLPLGALAAWEAIVFGSVLVHEYGHAFAMMRHGIVPSITLHAMGGFTTPTSAPIRPLRRRDSAFISLAGPLAGFAIGGIVLAVSLLAPSAVAGLSPVGQYAVDVLCWVNVFWGLVNLAPVLPFDGGNVLAMILGPSRRRITAAVSGAAGLLIALAFLRAGMVWGAMLFGMSAVQSYRAFAGGHTPEQAAPWS